MHFARLARSPRQQRILSVLSDGQEHSSRDIIRKADVVALSATISELRANGIQITARQQRRVWFYRLGGKSA